MDRRTPEHKRLLLKTTCGNPVKLRCLRGNATAKAPVHLASLSLTRSTWPDPNPAGRFYNHITDASCCCYCCSLRCLKAHNWIEEFMVSLFFFWGGGVNNFPPPTHCLQGGNLPSKSFLIRRSPTACLCGCKQRSGGLLDGVLFLNCQGSWFLIPTFSSYSEVSVHVLHSPISWRSAKCEHQPSRTFTLKGKEAKWQHITPRPPIRCRILANQIQIFTRPTYFFFLKVTKCMFRMSSE